jgi:hypothetical protein
MAKSNGDQGTTMKPTKRISLLLELLMLAASLTTGGRVGDGIQAIAVLVAAVVGGLAILTAVVLTIGVVAQRQPPYPI